MADLNQAYDIAQTKWRQGDIIGAYDELCNIFQYRLLYAQLNVSDAKIIQTLADICGLLGEFQITDNLLCGAINLHEQAQQAFWGDYARLRRIQLCLDRGNIYQAQKLLQEMAPRIGNINDIDFSSGLLQWEKRRVWSDIKAEEKIILFVELYLAFGRLLAALGQYGESISALERALFYTSSETVPSLAQSIILPIQLTYASVLIEKGNLEQAGIYLSEVRELVYQPENLQYKIRYLELFGKLNLLVGNLGAGLHKFQQVQELCSQLQLRRATLCANLNLAHVLILLNQTSTAQNYLQDTQVDASALGDTHLAARAQLLLQLCHARSRGIVPVGSAWEMRKRPEHHQAQIQIQRHLDLSSQSANYLAWFEDRALAFQWYLSSLNLTKANELLEHIKRVFRTDSNLITVQIRILEGMLCYYQGTERNQIDKIYRAHEILIETVSQLEQLDLKPELWQVQRMIVWCRTRLNYPSSQTEPLTTSTNQLLEQITKTLKQEDQVLYLLNKWTADEEYIATQINYLQRLKQKIKTANFWLRLWIRLRLMRCLNALVEHIDKYKDTLAKRTTTGADEVAISKKTFPLWRRLLTHPQDRVTLTFLILPDRTLIVTTGLFLFDFRVIPITRLGIRTLVQSWYKSLENTHRSRDLNVTHYNQYNQQLIGQKITDNITNTLQIPEILERIPKRIKALTIVPDDILHGFPFAAIIYQNKYLIQDYRLSICYESKPQRSKRTSCVQKALVVGISNGNNHFPSLPGVKSELKQINQWLDNHQINSLVLQNASASKDVVIESINKVNLLHIACHGAFNTSQPDQSGLVLINDSGKQEILTLRELSQTNLTKLRHITLSCCWSADHFILPGRWIISLPETLWRSGAESILGCLWEIDDTVAVSFMTSFYNYLEKLPRDEALRRTQLDCLNRRLYCRVDTANPLFWAGYNLYGVSSSPTKIIF
ncbi:MAG: CHAT domain-containing protein [Calothrix sp. C42_A2020_038]|nr:CHAT domain-containing protein [Calothrix sp. C42_A2020_038]